METLYFKVAEICFAVYATDASFIKSLLPSYAPFSVATPQTAKLTFTVKVCNQAVTTLPEGYEIGMFDCGGAIHGVFRTNGGYKIVIHTPQGRAACAMMCSADFSKCTTSLYGGHNDFRFGLGNAMMIAFAFSAAPQRVILIHASVPEQGGYGYLFLGKSGTGKSTHSKLWLKHIHGTELLNDDNPAIRVMPNGDIRVFGTPWSGKTPCYLNTSYPVGAIMRLEQSRKNVIKRESPIRAFASLLSACSVMIWDSPSYEAITQTVETVVNNIPTYYLQCLPDEAAAQLSFQTIQRHDVN